MSVTLKELKRYNQIGSTSAQAVKLFCPICQGEFSANPDDYFSMLPNDVFICDGEPMLLVREQRTLKVIA